MSNEPPPGNHEKFSVVANWLLEKGLTARTNRLRKYLESRKDLFISDPSCITVKDLEPKTLKEEPNEQRSNNRTNPNRQDNSGNS